MLENEFEKQVRSTLDGFKLRPSPPVWSNIEAGIREKRRRRLLLWVPVFVGIGLAGYFAWHWMESPRQFAESKLAKQVNSTNERSKNHTTDAGHLKSVSPAEPGKENTAPANPDSKPGTLVSKKLVGKGALKIHKTNPFRENLPPQNLISGGLANTDFKRKSAGLPLHDLAREGEKISGRQGKYKTGSSPSNPVNSFAAAKDVGEASDHAPGVVPYWQAPLSYTDHDFSSMSDSIRINRAAIISLSGLRPAHDYGHMKSLKWGIEVLVGASSRSAHPFKLGSMEKATSADLSFANTVYPLSSYNSVGGGILVLPPSTVKAGTSFKVGLTLEKKLSKRLSISTGLSYYFASDHIRIGQDIAGPTASRAPSIDLTAVAQNAYTGKQLQRYTNKFHFIEIPLDFHFNLTPGWKIPLTWSAGAALSRVVSANVLLYDVALGGAYYQGKDDLMKTQFGLSSGFSFRISGTNGWQWNIGPRFSFNTTPLYGKATDANKHLVSGGIGLQLFFPGKRK